MRLLATLAVVGLVLGACADPQSDPEVEADASEVLVRVDQGGYAIGEEKVAYAMGADDLEGVGFRVLDEDGATALDGEVGPATGEWSDAYPDVHRLDLTDLDEPGTYTVELEGDRGAASPTFAVAPVDELLTPPLELAVRFFTAQRDGAAVDSDVLDRQPSHLLDEEATVYAVPTYDDEVLVGDGLEAIGGPVDVSGGWFDAGDFLKITGTTAYATVALLLAERAAPETPGLADEAEIGLAWLDRMWDDETGVLSSQVGIGQGNDDVLTDHDVWRLPEDDDEAATEPGDAEHLVGHRPVFPANEPGEPISPNLAGRVSAAFALAAQRTADDDPDAAAAWLDRAVAVYEAADTDPGELVTAVPNDFYPEDSWADDLELAAAELAVAGEALDDDRAAGWVAEAEGWAEEYLVDASDVGGTLGVADVSAAAHAELIDLGGESTPELEDDLRRPLDDAGDLAADDPFGAGASTVEFDSAPIAFALVATAHLYERTVGDDVYRDFAARQRGWVLGANAWGSSFMIGVGTTYPRCPEHQVANLADAGELLGAVVNGPNAAAILDEPNRFETMVPCDEGDSDGRPFSDFDGRDAAYVDTVGSWQTSEPAIDFTATAVLALALASTA
jgi:hypothetical protein